MKNTTSVNYITRQIQSYHNYATWHLFDTWSQAYSIIATFSNAM